MDLVEVELLPEISAALLPLLLQNGGEWSLISWGPGGPASRPCRCTPTSRRHTDRPGRGSAAAAARRQKGLAPAVGASRIEVAHPRRPGRIQHLEGRAAPCPPRSYSSTVVLSVAQVDVARSSQRRHADAEWRHPQSAAGEGTQ